MTARRFSGRRGRAFPAGQVPGRRVPAAISRLALVPRVAWLSRQAPADPVRAWNKYWSDTGSAADVLWDSRTDDEMRGYLPLLREYFDPALPMVDVGCGDGRLTRWLGTHFADVVGVDLSPHAIVRAESKTRPGLRWQVWDGTAAGGGAALRRDLGESNVFVRGVFHVLTPPDRLALVRNLLSLIGSRGTVLLAETNFRDSPIAYLERLGASGSGIPAPLQRAIRTLPRPGHFGETERAQCFPADVWALRQQQSVVIETAPLPGTGAPGQVPGYVAVLAARAG